MEGSGGGKEKEAATLAAMERLGIDVTGLEVSEMCVVVCVRERGKGCVCEKEREKLCVRERDGKVVCVRERGKVCVVVSVRERGKERERECRSLR